MGYIKKMTAVLMVPGTYRQTPYNAPMFGADKGRTAFVGNRIDSKKVAIDNAEALSCFPLVTDYHGQRWHHCKSNAVQLWGFYEVA